MQALQVLELQTQAEQALDMIQKDPQAVLEKGPLKDSVGVPLRVPYRLLSRAP